MALSKYLINDIAILRTVTRKREICSGLSINQLSISSPFQTSRIILQFHNAAVLLYPGAYCLMFAV